MKRAAIWALGGAVSLSAHAALFAVLTLSLEPEPVKDQPLPTSKLDVQAYQVQRSEAQQTTPETKTAAPGQTNTTRLDQGTIAQSSSTGVTPPAQTLAASAPTPAALPVITPVAATATALAPKGAPLPGDPPPPVPVAAQTPAPAAILAATPDSASLVSAPPPTLPIATQTPRPAETPATPPDSAALPAATPAPATVNASPATGAVLVASAPIADAQIAQPPLGAALKPTRADPDALSASAPKPETLTASVAPAPALTAQAPVVSHLQAARSQSAALVATVAPATAIAPQAPAPQTATQSTPAPQPTPAIARTGPQIRPTAAAAAILPAAFTNPDPAPGIRPPAQPLPASTQTPPAATDLPIPAQYAVAALAFGSALDGQLDPASLIAFQSFTQPTDLSTSASATGQLRDGISALLAQVPCSRLQVNFIPETGTLMLNGHVPENGLRPAILTALQAQVGNNIKVTDNLLILKRPMCGALTGLASAGLPPSVNQTNDARVIGENTQAIVSKFRNGERLTLDFTAPDYAAYVYVDYFTVDGQVVHLSPNQYSRDVFRQPKTDIRIGRQEPCKPSIQIKMGPPFGQELGVTFASSQQLYDGVRPIMEPAEPYVEWIKNRIATARAQATDFKGEWFYFVINSSAEDYVPLAKPSPADPAKKDCPKTSP